MKWHVIAEVMRAVGARMAPLALAALIGAMADAGLLEGEVGECLVQKLSALLSNSLLHQSVASIL